MSRQITSSKGGSRGAERSNKALHVSSGHNHQNLPPAAPSTPTATKQLSSPRRRSFARMSPKIATEWTDTELERQYDLTPVANQSERRTPRQRTPSFTIDPFEFSPTNAEKEEQKHGSQKGSESSDEFNKTIPVDEDDFFPDESGTLTSETILPEDIHLNMDIKEEEIAQLRLLAGKLSVDWRSPDFMAPALARRIRDFQFAQDRRRKKYGDERPWGILGLYDHLSSIRIDVEWAEDAAKRRTNGEPYQSWADFDESKKRGRNRPYFTYCLLFICAAVVIASIAVNDWTIEPLDENAMIGPSAETLILMGAKETHLIVKQNEVWRILTSSVLHAGLVHYFINMLALWFVGAAIEMSHGWIAAMTVFTLSSIGGTILSAIFLPQYVTVGASGGIFGFIGACLADIIMNWRLLFSDFVNEHGKKHRHVIVVLVLFFDILLNLIIGLTPYVDNYNHLGGMIYGFLCGLSTISRLSADFFGMDDGFVGFMTRAKTMLSRSFGLVVAFLAIFTTFIVLLNGDGTTTPCPSCTWLSCVPFPPWESATEKWWYCDDCGRVSADIFVEPSLHLEMFCPSGSTEIVDLSNEETFNQEKIKMNLPSYCRQYCLASDS